MRFLRPAAALSAVAATLAFASSALANPTTPTLAPIAANVCSDSINVSWSSSAPDQGGTILAYQFNAKDLTSGATGTKYVTTLSTPIGLIAGHKYAVAVRAVEIKNNTLLFSGWSADAFTHTCLRLINDKQFVAYNPDEGCIMCGLENLYQNDPGIEKQLSIATLPVSPLRVSGLQIDAAGIATIVMTK